MRLTLTDTERIMLANQYDILAALHRDNKHMSEDYAQRAETLRDGHEWLYSQYFDWVSPNLPEEKVQHVLHILGIYGDMRNSFNKLTDKSGIDERELNFLGFDGNNESELLSFSEALRKHGRFGETIGPEAKNSHSPTTDIYDRMIEKWQELGKPNYPYSREQIIAIMEARIHPEYRK